MKHKVLSLLAAAGLAASLLLAGAGASLAHDTASPMFTMDKAPAVPAGVTAPGSPSYGLFSCQVGLSTGQCYDPYQMRAAYGIDQLIAAGFDGSGRTIVIIDAFQDPNIEAQLAYYATFYGLPAMNAGPGSPSFSIVAPDGLTAKARWRAVMQVGVLHKSAQWGEATYENEYVKDGGIWKIRKLHAYFTYYVDYYKGWDQGGDPPPPPIKDFPPDQPPTVDYQLYPDIFIPPYHYKNPVTGK